MNIAVFLPNWIGDVVMATPAIRALRQTYPQARLLWVGKPYVAGVIEAAPWFDDGILLDRRGRLSQRWLPAAWRLRRERIDLAILFPNTFRSAWVAWLAGCRRRLGFNRYGRGWLLTDRFEADRNDQGELMPRPIINDYNRLVQAAGCEWPGYRLELFTTAADEQAADAVFDKFCLAPDAEILCLNPGAAFGAAKHWHVESFASLAQELVDRRGSAVLVLCGPKERELARHIVRLTHREQVYSLADEPLSLGLTKALLRRASALVTTDSGPRHIAAAFDRPVVTLFGPTHIAWTETYHVRSVHLQKQVPCGPCQLRVCPLDHRCMKDLHPDEVFRAVNELLSSPLPIAATPSLPRKAS